MAEVTRNILDSHDWAARASEALKQAKTVAARIETIRSHQKSRTTSPCRRHEKLADGERTADVI
jgi:hypothetical protein